MLRVQEGAQVTYNKIGDLQILQQQSETAQGQRAVGYENSVQAIQDKIRDMQTLQQESNRAQEQRVTGHESSVQLIQDEIRDLQNTQQQIASAQIQRLTEHEATVQEPITQLLVAQQRLELKLDVVEARHIASNAESKVRATAQSIFNVRNPADQTLTSSTVQVTTTITRWQCTERCGCSCHRHRRPNKRTPNILDRFVGILFVGYLGLPYISERCDDEDCIQRSRSSVLIIYFFPTWLLARAMILVLRLSSVKGPELNLRIPRVVSNASRTFYCAGTGDVVGLKEIFHRGLGSPMDIDVTNGFTALSVYRAFPMLYIQLTVT